MRKMNRKARRAFLTHAVLLITRGTDTNVRFSHAGPTVVNQSPTTWLAGPCALVWASNWQPPRPCDDPSSPSPDGSPARRAASLCIFPSAGSGKTSSVAPWHSCEQFHSRSDGTAGVNADGDLTHSPDYPTASQTCARLVPERLWPHAALKPRPVSPPRAADIPFARLPHTSLSQIYWDQVLTSLSLASHPLSDRRGYIPSVDSGLGMQVINYLN